MLHLALFGSSRKTHHFTMITKQSIIRYQPALQITAENMEAQVDN